MCGNSWAMLMLPTYLHQSKHDTIPCVNQHRGHKKGRFFLMGGRERKREGKKERRREERRGNKGTREGYTALGILTLNSSYVYVLLLFISGISLNKSHECGEYHDMNVILQHHRCQQN